ncbi:MAG: hypothetical protein R3B71_04975 [Candidatus Gracilibacteria bacterium]
MIDRFGTVLKEIEGDIGTKDLNLLILNALIDALKSCKIKTVETLKEQMEEIIHIFNSTEPKYAIILYDLYNIAGEMQKICGKDGHKHDFSAYRQKIIAFINKLIRKAYKDKVHLTQFAERIKANKKTILIHDHSHTVQDVLRHLKRKGQKFRVIVAEQDPEKTFHNIEMLTRNKIPFQTVPAHMLSNIEDDIDMCFFGAVTFKSTFDFVVDTGTNAIISEFHLQKKPIYFFITTNKFALWKARKKKAVIGHIYTKQHPFKKIQFERYKFSHDRVPLSAIDFTVTDEGIFNAYELKKLYQEKAARQADIVKKMRRI